jgi:hypothetical protein
MFFPIEASAPIITVSEIPLTEEPAPRLLRRSKQPQFFSPVGVTVTTAASVPGVRKTDMHTLTFNDNERTLLILAAWLAKLPHEIHQTDNRAYRDMLEEKQGTLQQLIKRSYAGGLRARPERVLGNRAILRGLHPNRVLV